MTRTMLGRHSGLWRGAALAALGVGVWALAAVAGEGAGAAPGPALGVLQHDGARTAAVVAAGVRRTVLELAWGRAEPRPGEYDEAYLAAARARADAWRAGGLELVLDLGVQYPPAWALDLPCGRFVNQYGAAYDDSRPGFRRANGVFSRAVRERLAAYVGKLRATLGDDFLGVRLGWGHYGELNYPEPKHGGKDNCYWSFDAAAQGRAPENLAAGMEPCPVPGYVPGSDAPETTARAFLEWHFESLRRWHDWQIATVRAAFPRAALVMLYPSWGVRPGQAEAAIAAGLRGTTPAEKNGEVPRGLDFARCVLGARDAGLVVCCTWVDSDPSFGDDHGPAPQGWAPVHWLAWLAREGRASAGRLALAVWGENTGGGGMAALRLTAQRAREQGLAAVFWAFEPALFQGGAPTLGDVARAFAPAPPSPPVP